MVANGSQHTITALVQDKPGVLARVASLFRRRGFNIASLAVGNSEQPGLSRMTFVVNGDRDTVDQVTKQLGKLIDVVSISDLSQQETVARELALIKVEASPATRGEIVQLVHLFRAAVVDVAPHSIVVEITGEEDKIDALANLLRPFGIKEMLRTGRVAMVRGQSEGKAGAKTASAPRVEALDRGRVDYEGV
jgi:acetolactate synthase-1/3 small subunit